MKRKISDRGRDEEFISGAKVSGAGECRANVPMMRMACVSSERNGAGQKLFRSSGRRERTDLPTIYTG